MTREGFRRAISQKGHVSRESFEVSLVVVLAALRDCRVRREEEEERRGIDVAIVAAAVLDVCRSRGDISFIYGDLSRVI